MGRVEEPHWFDTVVNEIGFVFTKADETIQKSIELWSELTKDLFVDQPTQDSTHSKDHKHVLEVEEEPIQHRAMCFGKLKEAPTQCWATSAMAVTKVPQTLIQEQGDEDNNDDGHDDDFDYVFDNEEGEEGDTLSETSWYDWDDDDHHQEDEYEATVSESCENMSELNLGSQYHHYKLNDLGLLSKHTVESWEGTVDDDEDDQDEEGEGRVFESCENICQLNMESWFHHYNIQEVNDVGTEEGGDDHMYHYHDNEEDMASTLKRRDGYEILKDVETSSQNDDDDYGSKLYDDECVPLMVNGNGDYVGDKSKEIVNVKEEESSYNKELIDEVKTLVQELDWVYVTKE